MEFHQHGFITQLPPSTKANDAIMVVVDRLSKMVHAVYNKTNDAAFVTVHIPARCIDLTPNRLGV